MRMRNGQLPRQSYAGAIRQRLGHIEREIGFGLRHEAIRQDLAAAGFDAGLNTFRKSLWRARVWWRVQALMKGSSVVDTGRKQHSLATRYQLPGAAQQPGHPAAPAYPVPVDVPAAKPGIKPAGTPPGAAPKGNALVVQTPGASKRKSGIDMDQFFKRESVFSKPNKQP